MYFRKKNEEARLHNDTVVKEDDANNNNRQNQESLLELDGVHPKLISLQKDADLVIKLLGPGRDGVINAELVLAYLEAHMDRPERVQVVVEELAGIDNDDSQTPERQLSVEMIKSKKGKGKSSKSVNPADLEDKVAQKRTISTHSTIEESSSPKKKSRLDINLNKDKTSLSQSQPTPQVPIKQPEDPATIAGILNLADSLSDMFPDTSGLPEGQVPGPGGEECCPGKAY